MSLVDTKRNLMFFSIQGNSAPRMKVPLNVSNISRSKNAFDNSVTREATQRLE